MNIYIAVIVTEEGIITQLCMSREEAMGYIEQTLFESFEGAWKDDFTPQYNDADFHHINSMAVAIIEDGNHLRWDVQVHKMEASFLNITLS